MRHQSRPRLTRLTRVGSTARSPTHSSSGQEARIIYSKTHTLFSCGQFAVALVPRFSSSLINFVFCICTGVGTKGSEPDKHFAEIVLPVKLPVQFPIHGHKLAFT